MRGMEKASLLELLGLPQAFGFLLLAFGFALMVSPVLPGKDFGIIKIPSIDHAIRKRMLFAGIIVLFASVALHIPLWPRLPQGEQGSNPGDVGISLRPGGTFRNYESGLEISVIEVRPDGTCKLSLKYPGHEPETLDSVSDANWAFEVGGSHYTLSLKQVDAAENRVRFRLVISQP